MFDNIDLWFIKWFQYGVRQIELYTPIERKNLIAFFFVAMRNLLFAIYPTTALLFFLDIYMAISMVFSIFGLTFIFLEIKKAMIHQEKSDFLPKEIIFRKKERFTVVLYNLVIFFNVVPILLYVAVPFFNQVINNATIVMCFFGLFLISCFALTVFCSEYLLCTTPLPPGEKQKKLEEKETRNMVPVPINH